MAQGNVSATAVATASVPVDALDDDARLAALAQYDILDTPPEPEFDDLVAIAAEICRTPVSLISFVQQDRQWFKARVGFEACETPICQSVCANVLTESDVLVIPDLTQDARTKANTLVTDGPRIRFYAGAPMVTPDGLVLGALCVIDTTPRPEGLSDGQKKTLKGLARQVIALLELRQLIQRRDESLARQTLQGMTTLKRALVSESAERALRDSEARSRLAEEAGRIGTFELDVATDVMTVSPEFCRIFGITVALAYPASAFQALVVPEDAAIPSNETTRADGSALQEVQYRIKRPDDGAIRWVLRRATFTAAPDGSPAKMLGTIQDITEYRLENARASAVVELGDRLRESTTISNIAEATGHALGQALGCFRAGYGVIEEPGDVMDIENDWTAAEAASIAGSSRPAVSFPATMGALKRGHTLAIADIAASPIISADYAAYQKIGTRAVINVPVMHHDELVGVLFVHSDVVREWSISDRQFVKGVADRSYAAIAKVQAEESQQILNQELSHRLKNSFAMVQAIATQTLRSVPEREPVETFEQRLQALSSAHDILLQRRWTAAPLSAVVSTMLGSVGAAGRFDVSGPDIDLGARATLSFSLLLHELATNAVKYGALSNDVGRVGLTWRVFRANAVDTLAIDWRESGGPTVKELPDRKGFGSRLIRMGLVGTGGVTVRYLPTGFEADIRAPLAQVQRF